MNDTRKFVLVEDQVTDGMYCLGIFRDYRTAVGEAMESVWELKESYRDEGDIFEYSEFEDMEGDEGVMMTVKFKAANWEKELEHHYYIMRAEEEA